MNRSKLLTRMSPQLLLKNIIHYAFCQQSNCCPGNYFDSMVSASSERRISLSVSSSIQKIPWKGAVKNFCGTRGPGPGGAVVFCIWIGIIHVQRRHDGIRYAQVLISRGDTWEPAPFCAFELVRQCFLVVEAVEQNAPFHRMDPLSWKRWNAQQRE